MIAWIVGHKIISLVILILIIYFIRKLWKVFRAQAYIPPEQGIGRDYSEIIKMSFEQIQNIYRLNPERLRYKNVEISYAKFSKRKYLLLNYSEPLKWTYSRGPYGIVDNKEYIVAVSLEPIEAMKFDHARKCKPNRVATEEAILQAMQSDIDRLRQKAYDEINQAKEMAESVARRMNHG